jgi:hypothetical protein
MVHAPNGYGAGGGGSADLCYGGHRLCTAFCPVRLAARRGTRLRRPPSFTWISCLSSPHVPRRAPRSARQGAVVTPKIPPRGMYRFHLVAPVYYAQPHVMRRTVMKLGNVVTIPRTATSGK